MAKKKKKKRVVKRKKRKGGKKKKALKRKKRRSSKKAFGGYTINFRGCKAPIEKVFGTGPIAPSQMTKKLWAYVKRNRLNKK